MSKGASKNAFRITATSFYQYAKCPAWPWHEVHTDPDLRAPVSAMTERLWKEGVEHEERIIKKRWKSGVRHVRPTGDLEDRALQTLAYMKDGVKVIYQGVLIHGHHVGIPDLLERVEAPSDLGEWMYVPVDIKNSSHFTEVHKLQLCFYSELLKRAQGRRPERAYIIDTNAIVHEMNVGDYEDRYHLTLKEIEELLAGEKPATHLYGSCKQSPFYTQCILDAESCKDIALIYRIRSEEREKLVDAGFGTLDKLAGADLNKLKKKVRHMSAPRLERLKLQARCLRDHEAIVVEKPVLPAAKTEIYFDMESDPLNALHYLFGCLVVHDGKETYKAFIARGPKGEEKAWKEFQKFIVKFKDLVIYHYGWYEVNVIKELDERYGTTKAAARILNNREQTIDVLPIVSRSVLFPVYSYSLKNLAKFLGFAWRAKDASGANSIAWYHKWLSDKKKHAKLLQKIIDYNEDDVRATRVLVEWMKGQSV